MSENLEKRSKNDLRSLMESDGFKSQVAKALPKHLTPDRFIRVACTAMAKTPKLMDCSQASFFNALLSLSQLGLEPDGRRAHLIPFGNECQLIIDYKGLVELAMRSGNVSNIHADVVCENDVFVYDRGQIKQHTIDFRKPRGKVYAAYATVKFKDGTEKTEVMSHEEIEAIHARSKAGRSGPWITDWNEMAKKTVFRRLSKWIILSPEFHDILEKDFDNFEPMNQPSAKALIPPPPLKPTAPRAEESSFESSVEVTYTEEPPSNPATESEPPPDVGAELDIFAELDSKIDTYCNGDSGKKTEVYKTLTKFKGSDGVERSAWSITQLKGWKNSEKIAKATLSKFNERVQMGTKYKFEQ